VRVYVLILVREYAQTAAKGREGAQCSVLVQYAADEKRDGKQVCAAKNKMLIYENIGGNRRGGGEGGERAERTAPFGSTTRSLGGKTSLTCGCRTAVCPIAPRVVAPTGHSVYARSSTHI